MPSEMSLGGCRGHDAVIQQQFMAFQPRLNKPKLLQLQNVVLPPDKFFFSFSLTFYFKLHPGQALQQGVCCCLCYNARAFLGEGTGRSGFH